ncbi:TadE/TadG family type IV pilus assembly protein [Actibacterium lipolyticum]|uniref:TadE-like protein n=1 Tax=Actibacterium lipolyticum TaxID=1524263 RepID=A0A238JRV0_9RHOB|nr:TadE family protein [Actibacterium lipolyticum]SMX33381.1 TadE-like protein [Actibacterium lipolyticum]
MNRLQSLSGRFAGAVRRFRKSEDGLATMEFVILFPVFITIWISAFELAMLMTRQMFLERAVDITVRNVRLGNWADVSADTVRDSICENVGSMMGDCEGNIMLDMRAISRNTWAVPDPGAKCRDRTTEVQPVTKFEEGAENEMVILRACVLVDPFFPGTQLALILVQNTGEGFAHIATSGFVNEPGAGSNS